MKNIIYIADLTAENARLMPWRVPLEVVKHWPDGDVPEIWSGGNRRVVEKPIEISGVLIRPIPRIRGDMKGLSQMLRQYGGDILYFPIAFTRCYSNAAAIEKTMGCRIVWYLPGGWYSFRQCFSALKYMQVREVMPYLVQALFPKREFFRSLRADRLRSLLSFSDYTTRSISDFYPKQALFTALPGMDKLGQETSNRALTAKTAEGPYFLFFGPPNAIRGTGILLRAFESVASNLPDCRLHMCIRADHNANVEPLRRRILSSPVAEQIYCRWDSLTKEEIEDELTGCLAVVMPFLIVPAEIPLAVIESASLGKPVLCSGPDGTGCFASRFGLMSRHGDWRGLAKNMMRIATDDALREDLTERARDAATSLTDWGGCAKIWKRAGEFF